VQSRPQREGLYFGIDEDDTTAEWFTPKCIFANLECQFDLDPASPGQNIVPWIPVHHHYTSYGLEREWFGFVWLNPPYGRNVLALWLEKFARHGNGIALVPERTSTGWWQELVARADLILCVNKKSRSRPTRENRGPLFRSAARLSQSERKASPVSSRLIEMVLGSCSDLSPTTSAFRSLRRLIREPRDGSPWLRDSAARKARSRRLRSRRSRSSCRAA
jgi:hypothetical protein